MEAICSENPVPRAGKTRARLTVVERRRRPNAVFHRSVDVGSRPDAAVVGLRRVFPDRNGPLHRVFYANSLHQLIVSNRCYPTSPW